jgi:cytosine permease
MKSHPDADFPIEHVPAEKRKPLFSIAIVLLGFTFFSGTMMAGASLGAAYPLRDLLIVLLCGNILLGLYVATLSAIGARTGLTTVLLARYTLGRNGAKWADLLLGGTQVGWFGVTVAFMAIPFAAAFNLPNATLPFLMVVWGIAHGATAYFGYNGMEKLSIISVPLLLVLGLWSMGIAVRDAGGWQALFAVQPLESMAFATALTIIVGTFASGGTQAPNWARFARSPRAAFIAALIAFFFANGLMCLFGAFGGAVYGQPDLAEVLALQGLAFFGVIFLTLNLWTSNDNAAYAFGVAGAAAFKVNDKRKFIVIGSFIGIILAISGIYNFLMPWLITLGVLIPPLGGVIIADFWINWKGRLPRLETIEFTSFRWNGVSAYLLGCLAAVCLPGIPPVNGVLVAAIAVIVLRPLFAQMKGSEHRISKSAT